VTGHLPFDSEGVGDLLIRIAQNTPAVPSTLNAELPAAFDEWFKKACAKEPSQRFQTAREMVEALAKAVGIQAALSQPERFLVNLADSTDLDWGSLAGVRIPAPPPSRRTGPDSSKAAQDSALAAAARSREETLDGSDIIEVVEGSRPPPPPEAPPPSTRAAPPPPPKPPVPTPAKPLAPPSDNPFLADAPASRPMPSSTAAMSRSPSSGRGLQSTVTGLASTSDAPLDAPPELDGSRKRRAGWFVGLALAVTAVGVTFGVVQSRGGFGAAANPDPPRPPAPTTPAPTETQASQPVTATATSESSAPAPAASGSTSSSATPEAIDPEVTKKPANVPTASPVGPRPKKTSDAIEIEIPDPDKEVRLPRGQ
jgi:serine/threonine-protein kinase